MPSGWPLVGRREELQFVIDALASDTTSGVVLAGDAGVGKTRLASEAVELAQQKGMFTYWIAATRSAATIPFGALASLLPPSELGSNAPFDILRQGLVDLNRKHEGGNVVIAVDDAHLLDAPSAAFLQQVALMRSAFLIITLRSQEPVPDSIEALWKEELVTRLEVQSLSETEVENLLTRSLGGQIGRGTLYEVWTATRGNPLLLRELIASGLELGSLTSSDGVWKWTGPLRAGPRLIELIESRLSRLEDDEREVLEVLSLGEPLGIETMEQLTKAGSITSLERKGLIDLRTDGKRVQLHLSHPLYCEVVRHSMPALRQRFLLKKLAESSASHTQQRREDVLRIAAWSIEAGISADPMMLTTAAWRAISGFDYALAERLGRAAIEAGGGVDSWRVLAEALRGLGRPLDAEDALSQLDLSTATDAQRTYTAQVRAANLFFGLDRLADAERILDDACQSVSDPRLECLLEGQRAIIYLYAGDPAAALLAAQHVLELPSPEETSLVSVVIAAAPALALQGKYEQAQELIDRGHLAAARVRDTATATGQLLTVQFMLLWLSGKLSEAETLAETAYRLAATQRSRDGVAVMATAAGEVALAQGRVQDAIARLRESTALFREVDRYRFLAWSLGALARAYASTGDVDAANATFAEAEAISTRSVRLFAVQYELARAWVTAASGETSRAIDIALTAADVARTSGQWAMEAIALYDVARLGQPEDVAARLAELADEIGSDHAVSLARSAAAISNRDAVALDTASIEFEKRGAMLLAAEVASESARIHRADGRAGSAMAAAERARSLASLCEGAWTPLLNMEDHPSLLTRREREVAALAARGLASRDIAEKLVLSVRTIDNHLHHVYAKLGVNNRDELGALLSDR
ncbi:MAG: LuxR C-terminal-related transcriptional regulator [Actinomycetota bacterium]